MECMFCRIEVSRSADSIVEFLCWEGELGTVQKTATGRVAHVVCYNGGRYDERQMTITDVIKEG